MRPLSLLFTYRPWTLILISAFQYLSFSASSYAVPQLINYQGSLTRPDGTPLDTTVTMTFKLWSASAAGTQYWTETHAGISVASGLFNASLGQTTTLTDSILNHPQIWLGVTVGADAEMTPRVQLKTVAYSYRVGTLDGATAGSVSGDLFLSGRAALGPNIISGANSFAAGYVNLATGDLSSVSGGQSNIASGTGAHIGGGAYNRARGNLSVVSGGGGSNSADSNFASGDRATVSGGGHNSALDFSVVAGGYFNTANGQAAIVSGGVGNAATGDYSTVSGGSSNTTLGVAATIAGGYSNSAGGNYSAVASGWNCIANGDFSFVAGRNVKTNSNASGTFLWGDNAFTDTLVSGAANRVIFRASNGYRLYTTDNLSAGVLMNAGDGAWSSVSDSTKKRNRRNVDTKAILDKVNALPIQQWSYKSQAPSIEHIGPMAQDFWKEFHVGDDSLTISTIDPSGIALAAIQELAKKTLKQDEEIRELRAQVQSLLANQKQTMKTR